MCWEWGGGRLLHWLDKRAGMEVQGEEGLSCCPSALRLLERSSATEQRALVCP